MLTNSSLRVVVVLLALAPASIAFVQDVPLNRRKRCQFGRSGHTSSRSTPTARHSTTQDEEETSVAAEENGSIAPAYNRPDLPDYGKTRLDIENIHLEEKKSRRETWRRKDLFGSSLVDQTLQELENDVDFQETAKRYREMGAEKVSREERANRRRALSDLGVPSFATFVREEAKKKSGVAESESANVASSTNSPFQRKTPTILQINIGLYCNQACGHCHVESSPLRKEEMMSADTVAQCLKLLVATPSINTLDITGGAPELNANFRYLVRMARELRPDIEIIDRCNLTVLQEPGQGDLVAFLKENKVRIVASLPCYSEKNVDKQRGNGAFDRSISALLALNDAGYGTSPELPLDLVYNPLGAFLPPDQSKLEVQYKKVLDENFGILFNSLFTMTNMPIKRFADFLHRRGELKEYMDLLVRNYNADTTKSIMCLDMVSVGYDGRVYDCDFNQQLGYGVGQGISVFDMEDLNLQNHPIRHDNHCFGCTAGMGSS